MTTAAGEPVRPATATDPGRSTADTPYPEVALLSNGSYGVLITAAGAGVGTWRDLDVTRWREDATRDCWGQFCYVRDLGDGTAWSVGHQPLCRTADEYNFAFHADRAEFRRRDGAVETRLAVRVAPDHDAEVRVLPVRRCLRLPRPDPTLGRASVRGRGRAALVAPAGRCWRPHPHHRRPDVPAAGGPSLHHRHHAAALLDERVSFLKSQMLRPEQEEDYNLPAVSEQVGTVYEHCVRALEHGYRLGAHDLPLMGTGDWNDGAFIFIKAFCFIRLGRFRLPVVTIGG